MFMRRLLNLPDYFCLFSNNWKLKDVAQDDTAHYLQVFGLVMVTGLPNAESSLNFQHVGLMVFNSLQ